MLLKCWLAHISEVGNTVIFTVFSAGYVLFRLVHMKKSNMNTPPRRAKPINADALAALCQGIEQLVKGQLSFAQSFGLNPNRVFSLSEMTSTSTFSAAQLQQWLRNGKADITNIQQLFNDLMQHQLALLAALDGVALQALEANHPATWLHKKLLAKTAIPELLSDSNKRFQQVVTPGFLRSYVHTREKLA